MIFNRSWLRRSNMLCHTSSKYSRPVLQHSCVSAIIQIRECLDSALEKEIRTVQRTCIVSWSRQVAVPNGLFTTSQSVMLLVELPDTVTTLGTQASSYLVSFRPGNR